MADVTLPWAAEKVVVDLDVCVKTGRRTNETVTLRGSTTPAWITFLLLVSVIGYLLASSMTQRRYELTVPFVHAAYDHWIMRQRRALYVGLAGAALLVAGVAAGTGSGASALAVTGFAGVVGAVVYGLVNSRVRTIGVRVTRDNDLVLTRTHPDFAAAMRTAQVEPLRR